MAAYLSALLIILGLWLSLGRQLIEKYSNRPEYSADKRLGFWLVLALLGWAVLAGLSFYQLPRSVLSQGWSREEIESTQQYSYVLTAVLTVVVAWWFRRRLVKLEKPSKAVLQKRTISEQRKEKKRP